MGQEINKGHFNKQDFTCFSESLAKETSLLNKWFASGGLSSRPAVGGFEMEAWLVDRQAMPTPNNVAYLEQLANPLVVPELSKFNVELNGTPQVLHGDALRRLHTELQVTWQTCTDTAQQMGNYLVMTGVLPTIAEQDLTLANMSRMTRYRALNEQVMRMRQGRPLQLDINGREHLLSTHYDVMLESAATSFQIHTQVPLDKAVRYYNAAIIASAPMVAVSANSPFLFGKNVWEETRIPLFEQAVEVGGLGGAAFGPLKRVSFGSGYARDSVMEVFTENMEHFPVLLPVAFDSPADKLDHLRLHNGTIWRWNRPLIGFDDDGTPHLRIEHRAVSAGPSIVDAIANAAMYYGLSQALAERQAPLEWELDFAVARDNFYAAAKNGLQAKLHWQNKHVSAQSLLLEELLPLAHKGLQSLEIAREDIEDYLGIIEARVQTGKTGSCWQRQRAAQLGGDLRAMTEDYLGWQQRGLPVHEWSL